MTVSTTEIANKALVRIGVKTFDNTVDSAVIAQVKSNLDDLYNLLYARDIVSWDLDSIPDHAVGSIVSELAWHIRDDFGIPDNKKVSLLGAQQQARADLQALEEIPHNSEPTVINAY
jgi:hypothetical protein